MKALYIHPVLSLDSWSLKMLLLSAGSYHNRHGKRQSTPKQKAK